MSKNKQKRLKVANNTESLGIVELPVPFCLVPYPSFTLPCLSLTHLASQSLIKGLGQTLYLISATNLPTTHQSLMHRFLIPYPPLSPLFNPLLIPYMSFTCHLLFLYPSLLLNYGAQPCRKSSCPDFKSHISNR